MYVLVHAFYYAYALPHPIGPGKLASVTNILVRLTKSMAVFGWHERKTLLLFLSLFGPSVVAVKGRDQAFRTDAFSLLLGFLYHVRDFQLSQNVLHKGENYHPITWCTICLNPQISQNQ